MEQLQQELERHQREVQRIENLIRRTTAELQQLREQNANLRNQIESSQGRNL